jgi:hypothetical protein
METAHVARWCAIRQIPWGCVRVVSDDARTPISKDVMDLLESGRVSPWQLAKGLVRRPALAAELVRLSRSTGRAAQVIGNALLSVLEA